MEFGNIELRNSQNYNLYTRILTVFDNAEKTEVFYGIEDVSKAILQVNHIAAVKE
jgi:hypothetical protein